MTPPPATLVPGTADSSADKIASPPVEIVRSAAPRSKTPKFGNPKGFLATLRERVDGYFEETGKNRKDCVSMYVKTFIILSWFAASYVLLVFFCATWWQALLAAISLGSAMAAIGFNIQHDGGHGAYSNHKWVNRLMAMTLDMLGGSSFLWQKSHNQIHHSFTNITGHDGDIDLGILGRLSPHQEYRPYHRIQHVYLWFLYGFITFKWQFRDDIRFLFTGRLGELEFKRPRGLDLVIFIGGKLVFFTWAFVVPLLLHKWYLVLAFFALASFVQGLTLSVVFQLAHVMEEAEFPMPHEATNRIDNEWAIHQVETTVNFAPKSRVANWFTGGLNFQIEHHLFPQICHIHYPALAKIVESTCDEFGVQYASHESVGKALASHYRWLKAMGRPEATTAA